MTSPDGKSAEDPKSRKVPGAIIPGHPAFQQVHNHSPMGVMAIDAHGMITYANPSALSFIHLKEEEISGRPFSNFLQDHTPDRLNEGRLTRQEEITDQEFLVKAHSEKEQWVLLSSKVYRDAQGDIQTYLFTRDISSLKKKEKLRSYLNQAAEALAKTRDTESALDLIAQFIVPKFANWFTIDILKDGRLESVILKHEDPDKIEWARQYRRNYPPDPAGNTGSAVVLKSGKAAFVPVVTDEMIALSVPDPEQLKAVKQIGMRSVILAPMANKDRVTGVANFISSTDGSYFDEADLEFAQNFANLVGLALENTRLNEEAGIEIALRKQGEEKFHFLTDAIPHKLWTSGQDGRATYYNEQWYDYTGIHGLEPLRAKIWDLLHPDDRAIAAVQWPQAIQKGEATEMEQRLLRHDGVYRWHLTRFIPYQDENGQATLWVGTSTDIDEQKSLELQLASFNEELATTNEELTAVNEELASTNEELTETHANLQQTMKERETVHEQAARLAAIVDTTDDTIVSKTLEGIITSWNTAAERMFGYTQAEVLGKHISLIIPPSRLKEEEFIIGQVRQGNKVDHFETIRLAKDGREIPISLTISPIVDANGTIMGASKIARDISAQQAAQESAQRYTERLETLNMMIETIAEELDLNKILQKVTDATTKLTGAAFGAFFYNKVDEDGESYMLYTLSGAPREAFEKFGMPRNTAVFSATFSGQGVVRADDIRKDPRYGKNTPHHGMPEGHLPVVSYLAVPVISRSGAVIGGLFFGHPERGRFTMEHESLVTSIAAQAAIGIDNAKLYEKIKELNAKKDEFIGLASHELKTPLTSISGYLQILNMKTGEKSNKFLDRTIHQVQKLTALVNDLLDVSKIEAGKLQLAKDQFDIKKVVEDAIELIQHTYDKYEIIFETSADTCLVEADTQRIEQVLVNLLTNAIKYSPGANKVIVSLIHQKDEVKIGVKDFGIGIPASKLNQVFSRFYRIEDADPNISGLGIGLYLSHEIITRHHGKIWVESEPGKGSTFWFTLPVN
jgi:PAS domain S-box-containing protein